jgi:hypothetical protein
MPAPGRWSACTSLSQPMPAAIQRRAKRFTKGRSSLGKRGHTRSGAATMAQP